VLTPETSLLTLIDILHGLRSLEVAGVLPYDLTTESIELKDGRAFVAPLGRACLEHDGDTGFGCERFWDREDFLLGSSLHHAPEMIGGKLTGPSNGVWAAGLIFAELAVGQMPTRWFFTRSGPGVKVCEQASAANACTSGTLHKLDQDPDGREKLRESIYNDFRIDAMEGFDQAPSWAQDILANMLAKRPQFRWSAAEALTQAHRCAAKLGIQVPRKVRLEEMAAEAFSSFQ